MKKKRVIHVEILPLLKRNLLICAIGTGTVLGLLLPSLGSALYNTGLISPLIALVFFCQGATIDTSIKKGKSSLGKSLLWGAIVSQIIAPILAWSALPYMPWLADEKLGFILIAVMPPTLVSGVILTRCAKGDIPTALSVTILLNLAAVFTIPFNLNWIIGQSVSIDSTALLLKLLLTILIPAMAGNAFRRYYPNKITQFPKTLYFTPIIALSSTIFMSAASQAEAILQLKLTQILAYAIAGTTLHIILFLLLFHGGKLFAIDEKSRRAIAFCCSQKTLPITIAIWSVTFARDYPLALLPPIVFHFSQIYTDTFIANAIAKKENS